MSSSTWTPTMAQYGIFDISGGDASGWSTANRRAPAHAFARVRMWR
jgi:hypothetical protein